MICGGGDTTGGGGLATSFVNGCESSSTTDGGGGGNGFVDSPCVKSSFGGGEGGGGGNGFVDSPCVKSSFGGGEGGGGFALLSGINFGGGLGDGGGGGGAATSPKSTRSPLIVYNIENASKIDRAIDVYRRIKKNVDPLRQLKEFPRHRGQSRFDSVDVVGQATSEQVFRINDNLFVVRRRNTTHRKHNLDTRIGSDMRDVKIHGVPRKILQGASNQRLDHASP